MISCPVDLPTSASNKLMYFFKDYSKKLILVNHSKLSKSLQINPIILFTV